MRAGPGSWCAGRGLPGLLGAATVALAACGTAPPDPKPTLAAPAAWQGAVAEASAPPLATDWWQHFHSAELRQLIDAALSRNRDVLAAASRIAQARAQAQGVDAAAAARIDAALASSHEKEAGSGSATRHLGTLSASYEIDLGGRNRHLSEAAIERLRGSHFAAEALRVTVQAEVANLYFRVLSLRDRLALAQRSLGNAESTLALLQTQQRAGTASGLEVLRQQALVASVRAAVPPLQQQLQQTLDALAVLCGRPPQGFAVTDAARGALRLPSVQPGLPAQLLQRRPDVRQAEASLGAAAAEFQAARSALWPTLRLTAEGGVQGATLGAWLRSGSLFGALGAALTATVFDGGRRDSEIEASRARREELLHRYEQALLDALRDVEDNLAAQQRLAEQATHQQQVIEHARGALRLADARYRSGAADFGTVLDAQRVLLAAEDAQETILLSRFVAAVGLFRALGGGWDAGSAARGS